MKYSDPLERATKQRTSGGLWTDDQFRAARDKDLAEPTANSRATVIATLSCLLLAALLTSAKIVQIAERQEFGDARDRNLAAAQALDRVANFVSFNRPYDAILDLRQMGETAQEQVNPIVEITEEPTTPPATTNPASISPISTTTISTTATSTTATSTTATSTTATSTTATTVRAPLRTVTATEPLRVYVAGDSQAEYLGHAITTESADLSLEVLVDHRISTSLARPDYFNWPAELAAQVASDQPPEAVVLFIGANDYQDMTTADGHRLVEGTGAWRAEWTTRLEVTLDLLAGDDRHVYWVTQPPMRDDSLNEGVTVINSLAAPVIESRDQVSAVEIWELFGGNDGYNERLTDSAGETILARVGDGVHLSRAGASWVAEVVFAAITQRWDFLAN